MPCSASSEMSLHPPIVTPPPWRFAVGEPNHLRSSTWRVWMSRGGADVYMGARAFAADFKVSIHKSGQCHAAFDAKKFPQLQRALAASDSSRFVAWSPAKLTQGCSLAFRILIPREELSTLPYTDRKASEVTWLSLPKEGQATEIAAMLTDSTSRISSWPARRSLGTSLLAQTPLTDGRTFWLVYRDVPVLPWALQQKESARRQVVAHLDKFIAVLRGKKEAEVRSHLIGTDNDYNVGFIIECQILSPGEIARQRANSSSQ